MSENVSRSAMSAEGVQLWDRGRSLLRAYGLLGLTNAEAKARAGVLDRMGAFAIGEYIDLMRFLNANNEELGL